MKPREIVERIMTQHWDIAACKCWKCVEGRTNGCGARDEYLSHKVKIKVGRVTVEKTKQTGGGTVR